MHRDNEPLNLYNGSLQRVNVTLYGYNEALHRINEPLKLCNESLQCINVTLYGCNEALNLYNGSLNLCNEALQRVNEPLYRCNEALHRGSPPQSQNPYEVPTSSTSLSNGCVPTTRLNEKRLRQWSAKRWLTLKLTSPAQCRVFCCCSPKVSTMA